MRQALWCVVCLAGFLAMASDAAAQDAVPNGVGWAWGLNTDGQLGDNSTTTRSRAVRIVDSSGSDYLEGLVSITGSVTNNYGLAAR